MNKKQIVIQAFISFIVTLLLLLSTYFITINVSTNNAKSDLKIYGEQIALKFRSEEDKVEIEKAYENIISLRITILKNDSDDVILEINNIDKDPFEENRLQEFKDNINNFYYKDSKTLNTNVLYYVISNQNYLIRVGLTSSSIVHVANTTLISATIILFAVNLIYILILLYFYKQNFKKLNSEVNKLSDLVELSVIPNSSDEFELLSETIDQTRIRLLDLITKMETEQNKLKDTINFIKEGLIILSKDKKVILLNNYCLDLFQIKKDEILYKDIEYLLLDFDIKQAINNLKTNKKPIYNEIKIHSSYYSILIDEFNSRNFKEAKYTILINDITSIKNASIVKRDFLQNSSHELKSPLTTILAYEEMINNGLLNKEETKEAHEIVYKNSLRMKELIDSMLKLSSIEFNKEDLKKDNINIKNIIEDILLDLNKNISKMNLKITTNLEDVTLFMNHNEADILFRNLISNSIKYNKIDGNVEIILTKNSFIIKDSGIGIEKDEINSMFERFKRSSNSNLTNQIEGTGIGLSLVKHICINNNFKIIVNSEINKGSEFIVVFK